MSVQAPAANRRQVQAVATSEEVQPHGFTAPLLPWAVGLCSGIAINALWAGSKQAGVVLLLVAAAALVHPALRRRAAVGLALAAAMGAGILLHHRAFRTLPERHVALYTSDHRTLARVTGRVVGRAEVVQRAYPPFEAWMHEKERTVLLLAAESIETTAGMQPAEGLVRVSIAGAVKGIEEDSRIEAFGWLQRPMPPRNPGALDWATIQARRGICVYLYCDSPGTVRTIAAGSRGIAATMTRLRNHVSRLLVGDAAEDDDEAAFLDTMILGRRGGLDRRIEDLFVRTGCAHYLAVSGINVVLLALAIWAPAQWLGVTRRRTVALVLVAVAAYTLIADPRPPILRAAVMIVAYGLAMVLRRPAAALNALCLAAIVLLCIDPCWLFDVGFQLSFLAVLGIMYLVRPLTRAAEAVWLAAATGRPGLAPVSTEILELQRKILRRGPKRWWRRAAGYAASGVIVSIAAWLATLPITAATFGRVPIAGWLNSAIAAPFVTLVMLLGTIKIPLVLVVPVLDGPLSALLHAASRLLLWVMEQLSRVPHEVVAAPAPPIWLALGFYAVLLLAAMGGRWRVPRYVTRAVTVALALGAAAWWFARPLPDGLLVTQLAVGRGTSTVIETPDGHVWLYDAGASGSFDPGRSVIVPYLQSRRVRRLDGIFISHANLDHFGGVPAVLDAYPYARVYLAPQFERYAPPNSTGRALLDELQRRAAAITVLARGDAIELGEGVRADVLWPGRDLNAAAEVNDSSLVMKATHAGRSILLTGDIGALAQQSLIADAHLRADVLVLPHHGAVGPRTAAFLGAAHASQFVRSSFEHDAESPGLARIAAGRPLYNTADRGAIRILLARDEIHIAGFLPASSTVAERP